MYYMRYPDTICGDLVFTSDGEYITGIWMDDQKYRLWINENEELDEKDLPVFEIMKNWMDRYLAGEKPEISEVPIKLVGNEFRRTVWQHLIDIPYGEVVTYGYIAKKTAESLGKERMSAQAVGGAIGHNPIGILVPCHRVVGANGSLTGYGGGIKNKVALLEHEGVDMSRLFVPVKGTAL